MAPIILSANQPQKRPYKGGAQISAFRSAVPSIPAEPEDWIASTTCCSGHSELGLTRLEDGTLLIEDIEKNPDKYLSPGHRDAFGTNTMILVKLLHVGEENRLFIHAHPHRDWVRQHLSGPNILGKAEIWFALEPGTVHLGLRESISQARLMNLVENQETETLLHMMHEVQVDRFSAIFVPPGVLHSLGKGMFIVEVQEASDLSILCEWRGFPIDGTKHGHLGLGFPIALTAIETRERTKDEIKELMTAPNTQGVLNGANTSEYFVIERHDITTQTSFPPGYAILIVFQGELTMGTEKVQNITLEKGSTLIVPFSDGVFTLDGDGSVVIARPPKS